jgi:flagellum-specific peptidoglycan hydrolase FlgJ
MKKLKKYDEGGLFTGDPVKGEPLSAAEQKIASEATAKGFVVTKVNGQLQYKRDPGFKAPQAQQQMVQQPQQRVQQPVVQQPIVQRPTQPVAPVTPMKLSNGAIPLPDYNDSKSRMAYAAAFRNKYGKDSLKGYGDIPLRINEKPVYGTRTSREAAIQEAKALGLNPALFYASSMIEGQSGLYSGAAKTADGQAAWRGYTGDKDFPISALWGFGLDSFTNYYPSLVKKGYLPQDFDKQFKVWEEDGGPSGPDADPEVAMFKTTDAGIKAKAAMMRAFYDESDAYAKKRGYNLTPEQRDYFALAHFNSGAHGYEMMDSYSKAGLLKNNDFLNSGTMPNVNVNFMYKGKAMSPEASAKLHKQIYGNISPRIAAARGLQAEGYFEYGGKINTYAEGDEIENPGEKDINKLNYGRRFASLTVTPNFTSTNIKRNTNYRREYKYNPGTKSVDFKETGDLSLRPSYFSEPLKNGGRVPKYQDGTPDPIPGMFQPSNNFQSAFQGQMGEVPINPDAPYNEQLFRLPQEEGTQVDQGDIVPINRRGNPLDVNSIDLQQLENISTTSMAAINAFFNKTQQGQAGRTNNRNAIMQNQFAPTSNPYLNGTGSQAIFKKGGELQGQDVGLNILGGGNIKSLSDSDHSNPMIQFNGRDHKNGGIGLEYNGNIAEVENKEVGWVDGEGGLNIFGKLKLPGTNQTFRKTAKDIASQEKKVDGMKSKYLNILNNGSITDPYQETSQSTAKVMFKSLDKQSKQIAEKKEALASYQNLILNLAENESNQMKFGGKIPKYAEGGSLDPTNPQQIQKIIDKYSNGKAPLKAEDFIEVANKYNVPLDLMLAQAIQESNIGTKGRAVRTKNIFNIGNTDDGTANYKGSWKSGLESYAKTISNEYIGKGNTASTQDLLSRGMTRVKDGKRYASDKNYVNRLNQILGDIGMGSYTANNAATQVQANGPTPRVDYTTNFDPVYNPLGSSMEATYNTQYGDASRQPANFTDNTNLTTQSRQRGKQSPLDISQITPELLALSTNRREPVYQLNYQPDLQQTFDISYQLGRNENQASFSQAAKLAESAGAPEMIANLAAQKYQADQAYTVQEIQGNAAQRLQTYNQNTNTLNDAKVRNLSLISDQQTKQAQAKFNTRLEDMSAIKSISAKNLQNQLENKTYNAYANLFQHYGFDSKGNVTFQPDKIAQKFTAGEAQQFGFMAAQQGAQAIMNGDFSRQFTKVKNTDGSTTTTETLGTNKKIQDEYKALKNQGFDDNIIGNILRAKFPETITNQ